jgi:hypothetical protein
MLCGAGVQGGAFREVLLQQTIGILIAAALPRRARIAGVDQRTDVGGDVDVPGHFDALIPCDGPDQRHRQVAHGVGDRNAEGVGIARRKVHQPNQARLSLDGGGLVLPEPGGPEGNIVCGRLGKASSIASGGEVADSRRLHGARSKNTVKPALAHDEPPKYLRPQRGSIVDEVKPASVSFAGEDLIQKWPIVAVVATGELRKIQGKPAKEQGVEIRLDSSDSQELPVAALVAPTETGQLPSGMLAPPCGLPGAIQEYLDAHNQDPAPTCGPPPPNRSSRRSHAAASPSKKSANSETHHQLCLT